MKINSRLLLVPALFCLIACLAGCRPESSRLFRLLSSDQTGIDFTNTVTETDSFNILTYDYIYNGGGVAIGDFNNDGKQDVFFSGNQVSNRLYLNIGDLKFRDVTEQANVNVKGRWSSGIATIDINNDGWLDLFVCATTNPNPHDRRNMLFINQGLNKDGTPTFKESAVEYGLDYNGHSVMAGFLDYDRDGDLDLYVLVNEKSHDMPTAWRPKVTDGSSPNTDRLFRNNGNNTFTDVTIESKLTIEGFGLGLAISDFNNDGWPDIYVSNDYMSNDILCINQRDGTFANMTSNLMGHQSQFSMGSDAADINNDGLIDLITVDMLPETNERKKTTIGNKSYFTTINNERFHYEYQYVRNMLQLNNGAKDGIKFSEIGQLSGIYQTEWSWSPLFMDFDNDGDKDLAITNGFPKDITDKDFANYRNEIMNFASPAYLVDSIPVIKIPNYAFRNNGDLTFTDVSAEWGLNLPSFSNGAAAADFDNDGDLDYVVSNINAEAFVYENTTYDKGKEIKEPVSYLRVRLAGPPLNLNAIGAKVTLWYDGGKQQYHDHSVYRGYLSSVEDIVHFGLGAKSSVDSLVIIWPDDARQVIRTPASNQVLTASYKDAVKSVGQITKVNRSTATSSISSEPLFADASKATKIKFRHTQTDVIDFNIQRTISHKYSEYGPAISVGDINGDKLDDFFVAGAAGVYGTFFLQEPDGTFRQVTDRLGEKLTKAGSDNGTLLFDADNDGDLDLYIVGGGFEWEKDSKNYQDHLYKNDGKGFFKHDPAALPLTTSSGSCVRAADYDGDGDLDLFVGGRVVPWQYPYAPESYILKNDKGKFTDVTDAICPGLKNIGMVTDALWSDFDADGKVDLVLVGELMAPQLIRNGGSSFSVQNDGALSAYKGWWSSLAAGDFDQDGDIDYIAGNLGQNNYYHVTKEHPLRVIAKDLDNNGSVDAITACYFRMKDGSMQSCPAHFWDELNMQSPRFRRQFSKYKNFSKTTIDQLLSAKDLEGAVQLEANYSSSSFFENLGGGNFKISALPVEAQFAPVFGLVVDDLNQDGFPDVAITGNEFGNEVFSGRYDAQTGLVLLGDGTGKFESVKSMVSKFYVAGDARALVQLKGKNNASVFVASQNKDSLKVFVNKTAPEMNAVDLERDDAYAIVKLRSGKQQRFEFYYGEGAMSQSARRLRIPAGSDVTIKKFSGASRFVKANERTVKK